MRAGRQASGELLDEALGAVVEATGKLNVGPLGELLDGLLVEVRRADCVHWPTTERLLGPWHRLE